MKPCCVCGCPAMSADAPAISRSSTRLCSPRVVGRDRTMPMHAANQPHTIGSNVAAVDGLAKVSGSAIYTFDRAVPGMLHAKILRSPHAHARIRKIDSSRALRLPGIHVVVTGADLGGMNPIYGMRIKDQPVLAVGKVRYVGDSVAAVVADDETTAFRALSLIDVDYEVLPPVMTVAEAM